MTQMYGKDYRKIDYSLKSHFRKYFNYFSLFLFFVVMILKVEAQEERGLNVNHLKNREIDSIRNSLSQFIGKPFSEYHIFYKNVVTNLLHDDSLARVELVWIFKEAAFIDKSGEWKLLANMVENTVRFYESRKGGYTWSSDYTAEDYAGNMVAIAEQAEKKGFRLLKIFALFNAAEGYQTFVQNYERAFTYYLEAALELETISSKEFPPRPYIYIHIAGMYFLFGEYEDAIKYYRKVITDPDVRDNYYHSLYPALNGLGLCYRYAYDDYSRSDSCFRKILHEIQMTELDRLVWEGITEGNIGHNYYLRQEYDTALLWLIPTIEKITRHGDFTFVSNRAVDIADIYLKKNQPVQAKKYIDIAQEYFTLSRSINKQSIMYEVVFKYYMHIGDKKLATLYYDSILMAKNRENETYNALVLRHIEQQLRASDKKNHEQELQNEKNRNQLLTRIAIIISVALVIILFLLWIVFLFYRRKRNAYRELVRQTQIWAGVTETIDPEDISDTDEQITIERDVVAEETNAFESGLIVLNENDQLIMESIEKEMIEKDLYKRANLSLDLFAAETGINRYYISGALNRSTGKNFSTYVNEYRIKEAIRIMSGPTNKNLTIDKIAYDAGFNDRQSFHRVFKKKTGLSPSDFRKNIGKE